LRNYKKALFSRFLGCLRLRNVKSKYLSKWCSNRVALTIYVNATVLHSLPMIGSLSRRASHKCEAVFHLRGQEICVCLNGWVIFS